ncbi:MAG: 39S ribosomal protein L44, mitochondrial [Ramalina farinacea]|uniref:Large ribosomal subunit protein mL53 n=1 Tax=Ramalina farinacea TaxID=258253 RepID=A0AA43TUL1_9LECA|nr:39S ribosomal protein L44, mitochondrial [Ramalina farinacea]
MITKHLSEVTTKFNPFSKQAKTCRIFLATLPANARQTMKINSKVLPRDTDAKSELKIKFKDGREMQFDPDKHSIKDVAEEVDRHSRVLNRQAELAGS